MRRAPFQHDREGMTLEEVAKVLGISRARVGQIEQSAIRKLARAAGLDVPPASPSAPVERKLTCPECGRTRFAISTSANPVKMCRSCAQRLAIRPRRAHAR